LQSVDVSPWGLSLTVKADEKMQVGYADNLIIETFMERPKVQKDGKPAKLKGRFSLGFFPAIPIEIVPR
jgi:hypothetical protein